MKVKINGTEYELAKTLRVAYKVQGQHNHKPYTEVFQSIGDMVLEDQIGILYAAFECANPGATKHITRDVFLDHYLDNYNLKEVMDQLTEVIAGVMGKTPEELKQENEKTTTTTELAESTQEN